MLVLLKLAKEKKKKYPKEKEKKYPQNASIWMKADKHQLGQLRSTGVKFEGKLINIKKKTAETHGDIA